jgi:hypothetical protein
MLSSQPAERADAVFKMKNFGVWILGETRDDIRKAGMGIVVEYAGQQAVRIGSIRPKCYGTIGLLPTLRPRR